MAVCRFCGQEFGTRQGVRAHLKACAAYLGRSTRETPVPQATDGVPPQPSVLLPTDGFEDSLDPVTKMRQQVTSEKLRLKLREIQQQHEALDAEQRANRQASAESQAREAKAQALIEREREAARAQRAREAQSRREAADAKERRKVKRRQVIQDVKQAALDRWRYSARADAELKAKILRSIELALVPLPVDELPQAELVQIAEGVRDRLYGEVAAAEAAAAARAQQRESLRQYGLSYTRQQLIADEDFDWAERWRIECAVTEELQAITGEESRAEVRAWVEEILDMEGFYGAADEDIA